MPRASAVWWITGIGVLLVIAAVASFGLPGLAIALADQLKATDYPAPAPGSGRRRLTVVLTAGACRDARRHGGAPMRTWAEEAANSRHFLPQLSRLWARRCTEVLVHSRGCAQGGSGGSRDRRAASAGPWSLHPASPPLPGLVDARPA